MEYGRKLDIRYEEGNILRAEFLNQQADETTDFRRYLFSDYPDGIVSGCTLINENDKHFFSEGLVKLSGELYTVGRITEEMILNDVRELDGSKLSIDTMYYLGFVPSEQIRSDHQEASPITVRSLQLTALREKIDDAVIAAKFQISAEKIQFAEKLEDHTGKKFSTRYGDYSIAGGKAVSPDITLLIKDAILNKDIKDHLDTALFMACANGERLSQEALRFYCSSKLKKSVDWDDNIISNLLTSIGKTISFDAAPEKSAPATTESPKSGVFDPNL